jgi:phosphoglycolate phosphatase
MSKILGVIFDKDGTLFDFGATWGGWAASLLDDLSRGDRFLAEQMGKAIGFDIYAQTFGDDSPVIAGTPGEIAEYLLPFLPGSSPSSLISHMNILAAEAPQAEAVPLQPLLGRLRARGLRLGVATNDAELPARAHLESVGIADLFDFVSGSDSGYGAKPQPGMLLAFAKQMRLSPSSIAMVGDSRHDILAGRAAGMVTVAVVPDSNANDGLGSMADKVVSDIGELPGWIEEFGLAETLV